MFTKIIDKEKYDFKKSKKNFFSNLFLFQSLVDQVTMANAFFFYYVGDTSISPKISKNLLKSHFVELKNLALIFLEAMKNSNF